VEWAQQRVLGASAITKIIKAFRKVIVDGGYLFGIYCNEDWYNNVLDTASLPYDYWLASYPYNDRGVLVESLRPDVGIGWQYSSKGTINGISGHVDLDVFYKYFEIRPASDYFIYVVQAGDTLSEIALLYGVTVEELALLNEIVDIDLILVGQELKIPVKQYEAWVGECTGNGVHVRRGPGTEYLPIEGYPYLNKGNLVDVIGESRSTLGVLWYYVWIAKKYKGYVRSDYIQKI
jgi:LysM repeat protein